MMEMIISCAANNKKIKYTKELEKRREIARHYMLVNKLLWLPGKDEGNKRRKKICRKREKERERSVPQREISSTELAIK